MADDLRARLAAHPLLNNLTPRQLDTVAAIANGDLTEPRLPAEGEIWTGVDQHTVEVIGANEYVKYRVLSMPYSGAAPGHHTGPWTRSLREFLERFDPPAPPSATVASGDMAGELPAGADRVVDLMQALEDSVAAAKKARRRRTAQRTIGGGDLVRRRLRPRGDYERGTVSETRECGPGLDRRPHALVHWNGQTPQGWYPLDDLERIP